MSSRRLTAIVAGLVILLALTARAVIGGSRGASDIAVDTTGATARATMTSRVLQATVAAKPLLVISPRTVRHGASIGLWGSGFPSWATVDIYLKQEASDSVNPVTVVEADKNGQFTGVTVTVPDSVPSGSLIIQAKEYQGSLTAMATATVTDGADAPQAATPTAAAAATPTALAATPTTAPAAPPRATAPRPSAVRARAAPPPAAPPCAPETPIPPPPAAPTPTPAAPATPTT